MPITRMAILAFVAALSLAGAASARSSPPAPDMPGMSDKAPAARSQAAAQELAEEKIDGKIVVTQIEAAR